MIRYARLVFERASSLTWKLLVGVLLVVGPLIADAIWGDAASDQKTAWIISGIALIVFLLGILIWAPYQMWKEDQAKLLAAVEKPVDPLVGKRRQMMDAVPALLTATTELAFRWPASDDRTRKFLFNEFSNKNSRVRSLADSFIHEDAIHLPAQNFMNRCGIAAMDLQTGLPNHIAISEARKFAKVLQSALAAQLQK